MVYMQGMDNSLHFTLEITLETQFKGEISMLVKIMKKKKDGTYCYIGKNKTETQCDYMAVQLTRHDAEEYRDVLSKDGCEYFIVEA